MIQTLILIALAFAALRYVRRRVDMRDTVDDATLRRLNALDTNALPEATGRRRRSLEVGRHSTAFARPWSSRE